MSRKLVAASSLATLTCKYIIADVNKAFKHNDGMPYQRNPRLPLKKDNIKIKANNNQFTFSLPNFTSSNSTVKFQQHIEDELKNYQFVLPDNFYGNKIYTLNKKMIKSIKLLVKNDNDIKKEVNQIIKNDKSPDISNIILKVKKLVNDETIHQLQKEYKLERPKALKDDIEYQKHQEIKAFKNTLTSIKILNDYGNINFKSKFSWKDTSQPLEVEKILTGEYILSDSLLTKKNGDYFLLLTVKCPDKKVILDAKNICGIDLGVNIPVYVATNFNLQRQAIGYKSDIYNYKNKAKNVRRLKQSRSKNKQKLRHNEYNWQRNYCQTLAKRVIEFCLRNNCGTIHLEDLSNIKKRKKKIPEYISAEEKEKIEKKAKWFKRLLWTPYKLRQAIEYKASQYGIKVVVINPKYTSRRCSKCGHVDKTKTNVCRPKQSEYKCSECNEKFHADYNAAKNIALATGSVIANGYGYG